MIKLIVVGKIKEQYLNSLIDDYKERINKYHKIEIIEVKDSTITEEAKEILKNIGKKEFIITLEINGKKMDSISFASMIDKWFVYNSTITFIIGGSNGLDKSVTDISNYSLSFGDLTYPHGLFRGILLEQIYRAFKINNNETYHK